MIKITKELLSRWFDEVNNEFFNNELRKPDFVITHNRGYFWSVQTFHLDD